MQTGPFLRAENLDACSCSLQTTPLEARMRQLLLHLEDEEAHIYQSMKSFPALRTIGSSLLKPLASRSCSTHSRSLFPEYLVGLSPCVILPRMCFFLKILVERSR